jgi:prepilin-type N-terminal cleavage/methylation domain-containing protein
MQIRKAFTMIELVFVIVIMGILAKFGVEFLARAYESFIFSSANNKLQSNSATAVEFIANRLQYRIKDSVIVRQNINNVNFTALASAVPGTNYQVLEWVSTDINGFRGTANPLWSGILDLDAGRALGTNTLESPATDTNGSNLLINSLSYGDSGINNAALYFIGSNNDINGYGWGGAALADQSSVMHPIKSIVGQPTRFESSIAGQDFSGVDIYEYYQLAWTANAIVIVQDGTMWNLEFYYDYQPWNGEKYYDPGNDIKHFTLMEDVSTFQAMAIGSIIKIQVCTKSNIILGKAGEGGYSLCKEKTVY